MRERRGMGGAGSSEGGETVVGLYHERRIKNADSFVFMEFCVRFS